MPGNQVKILRGIKKQVMLRSPQFTAEQRIFMVNMKAQGDSYRVINHDFRKAFPFSGRDPSNMTIYRQKKSLIKKEQFII